MRLNRWATILLAGVGAALERDGYQHIGEVCLSTPLLEQPSCSKSMEGSSNSIPSKAETVVKAPTKTWTPGAARKSQPPRPGLEIFKSMGDGVWEIRPSEGKGLGVFAVRPIQRGERIMIEPPLFTLQKPVFVKGRGYDMESLIGNIEKAYAELNATGRDLYQSCYHERFGKFAHGSREVRIFQSNAYTLSDGSVAIFPLIAKINHSCAPNGANVWSEPSNARIVWAQRDIAAGEEITVTYIPLLVPTSDRRGRLRKYNFLCQCEACSGGHTDAARRRLGETMLRMEKLVKEEAEVTEADLDEVVEMAREVEELPGLADYLATTYRLVAYLAVELGKFEMSREWVAKELEVHRFADEESQYVRLAEQFMEQVPAGVRL